ncbi:MAG: hypothetical protein CSA22_03480 [Deltaproteobacteria bacterium]|nr:MAG: hypothetical protein CSA22_03480 [Deltaproteobacteria bacterium]
MIIYINRLITAFLFLLTAVLSAHAGDPVIMGRIELPSSSPCGLAYDAAHFWFIDADTVAVIQIDQAGNEIGSFVAPGTSPKGLCFDGNYLGLSERANNLIYKLDTQGNVITCFSAPGNYPRGLTFDGTHLWVADDEEKRIYHISTAGQVLHSVNAPNKNPYGLAYDGTHLWSLCQWRDNLYQLKLDENVYDASFLVHTRWAQRDEYATFIPDHHRAGCWSTELAQILYYHRKRPTGHVAYCTSTGYELDETVGDYAFNWNLFVDELEDTTAPVSVNEVARYIYYTALVIQKDFNTASYVIPSSERVNELMAHYDVTAAQYTVSASGMDGLKSIVKKQVNRNKPVMTYLTHPDIGHAVVIDAVKETGGSLFVHVNMGHEGRENSWYDFDDPPVGCV